jgi:hypothetical protein
MEEQFVLDRPELLRRHLKHLRFVVGGTPRGGTKFLAGALTKLLGEKVGHEEIFTLQQAYYSRLIAGRVRVDVSGGVPYHLDILKAHSVPLVHLIRDPVRAIHSMVNHLEQPVEDCVERWRFSHWLLRFYKPVVTIRLEDPVPGLLCLANWLNMEWSDEALSDALNVNRGKSTPGGDLTFADLPDCVKSLAVEMGYGKRIELHRGPDSLGRYSYSKHWWTDYHPGHPAGEYGWRERGQHFFCKPQPEDHWLPQEDKR